MYLIEVYKKNSLVNVDKDHQFGTLEAANKYVKELYQDQKNDNEAILLKHTNEIESQLYDNDMSDSINLHCYQYNYGFKIAKYSNRQINKMP